MKSLRVLMIGSIALLSFCFSGWRCSSAMDRDGKVLLFLTTASASMIMLQYITTLTTCGIVTGFHPRSP